MGFNAGKLDQRITFQSHTATADSYGQMIETWATAFSDWAEMITTGGGEFYAAQKQNAEAKAVFRVRYRAALDVAGASELYQIKVGTRVYQILNIAPAGRRVELLISAKEVV